MPKYYAVYPLLLVSSETESVSTVEIINAFKNPEVKQVGVSIQLFHEKSAAISFAAECKKRNENNEDCITPIFEISPGDVANATLVCGSDTLHIPFANEDAKFFEKVSAIN